MKKQIVVTDSNGKETVVEGNFDDAVNVKLENVQERWWYSTTNNVSRFHTTSLSLEGVVTPPAASTKKEAILTYIKHRIELRDRCTADMLQKKLEIAVKELKNHE